MIINMKKIDQAIWHYLRDMDDGSTDACIWIYNNFQRIKKTITHDKYFIDIHLAPFSTISTEEIEMFRYNNYNITIATTAEHPEKQNSEYLIVTIEDPKQFELYIEKNK